MQGCICCHGPLDDNGYCYMCEVDKIKKSAPDAMYKRSPDDLGAPWFNRKPTIYVCSGLEHATELDWRQVFKDQLKDRYKVILPDVVPCPHKKGDKDFARWYYDNYIQKDIADIYQSDEFFAYIDESFLNGAGGKSEITLAKFWHVPITYCVMLPNFTDLPAWTIGCLVDERRVYSLQEAAKYYKENANDPQKAHAN